MTDWQSGVTIVRGESIEKAMRVGGRATAFDFEGTGGEKTWIGMVTLPPAAKVGAHHHDRLEVAVFVAGGRGEISWGERLEYSTEVVRGDFVYFAPYVPHQERNLSPEEALDFVVVRSDNEPLATKLDVEPVERQEIIV